MDNRQYIFKMYWLQCSSQEVQKSVILKTSGKLNFLYYTVILAYSLSLKLVLNQNQLPFHIP